MSALTSSSRPDFSAPMSMTMSSSVAPAASAPCASKTFVAVVELPCGKPITVPTWTSDPSRIAFARRTSTGRTHTDATSYSAASRQPLSTNASSSSGRNREWSIVLAIWRSVRVSTENDIDSDDQWPEYVAGQQESALDEVLVAFERAVFVFDRDRSAVTDAVQRRNEPVPADLAETRQPRDLPAHAGRHDAVLEQAVPVDLHVLGVDVMDPRPELPDRPLVVDELPHEVRRIEVQPEVVGVDDLEQPAPDRRGVGEVLAARPFVAREDHRAILDDDRHPVAPGEADEVRPDLLDLGEVVRDRSTLVAADERPHERHAQKLRRDDHLAEVLVGLGADRLVRIEVARVVGECADLEAPLIEVLLERGRAGLVEAVDVEVADAGVAAAIAGHPRPAGDLERLEALGGRPVGKVFELHAPEGGGHQTQLHALGTSSLGAFGVASLRLDARSRWTSTQRPSWALVATASLTSISSWPAANVAYAGSGFGRPAATSA